MSARLFKKVLKEQEQLLQKTQHEEEEEEEEQSDSQSPDKSGRSSINPFDLLNDGEDDCDDDEREDLHQDEGSVISDDTLAEKKDEEKHLPLKNYVKQNQKSKKKKKKKNNESAPSLGKTETSLDEDLESLSLDFNSSSLKTASGKDSSENVNVRNSGPSSVLQVDPKYLNVENELRRIFGSKVVRSFGNSNQSGTSRQARGGRRGSYHIRKTFLYSPSEHWPRWDGSFSMELLETKDGYHYFRYIHSPSYEQAQRAFEAAQAIHDLNGVASVLLHHPYHLDSLITMADYFKFVGEQQMSVDAIGKCLYALECAWVPSFTPFQGNCRLKFHHETNKPLFSTLFSHMRSMDRRGCHRSALEVCKLLLSLDPDDPVGALFCLDYFALRAEEYAWLERFSEEDQSDSSLWLFPNFSYSLAICRMYLEREESSSSSSSQDASKSSSEDLMKQALMLHPAVLNKLVAKVPLKEQAWTKILQNSYFKSDKSKIPSLDHLINIYVERSYLIWRLPDNQKLLRKGAELVIEELAESETNAKDWACVRNEAFPSEKNEYSHLSVQDFSDAVVTLPPDNLQNFVVDPRMMNPADVGNQQAARPPRDAANRNPLAVLFESMLPWVHYGDDDPNHQLDGHDPDNNDHQ